MCLGKGNCTLCKCSHSEHLFTLSMQLCILSIKLGSLSILEHLAPKLEHVALHLEHNLGWAYVLLGRLTLKRVLEHPQAATIFICLSWYTNLILHFHLLFLFAFVHQLWAGPSVCWPMVPSTLACRSGKRTQHRLIVGRASQGNLGLLRGRIIVVGGKTLGGIIA